MGVTTLDPSRYGRLLSKTLPKVIETDKEFDRMVETLEELDFSGKPLTPEERALQKLLARLIQDYDETRHPLPQATPHGVLRFLMEQRSLRQANLVPVLGSRAQVSDIVNGRRGISKAQARRLAQFFHTSVDVFI